MNFLAESNLIYNQENAWVIGVCVGIILVCSVLITIKVVSFIHYNNNLDRAIRRREKFEKFRNKRNRF